MRGRGGGILIAVRSQKGCNVDLPLVSLSCVVMM